MPSSNLTAIPMIAEGSEATPGLWNTRFAQINDNFTTGVGGVSQGAGSPEGVTTAAVSTLYLQTDGTRGKTLWRKLNGSGNTGWGLMESHSGTFNIVDYGAASGTDSTAAITACLAAACTAAASSVAGAVVVIPNGSFINTAEQLIDQNYVSVIWDHGAIIDYRPSAISTLGTVSAATGAATFTTAQTGVLRNGSRINLPDVAGVGTVTATNGALSFSTTQVGKMGVGTRISVSAGTASSVPYTLTAFSDATTGSCTKYPTFGASAFTFANRSYICSAFNSGMTGCTLTPNAATAAFSAATFAVAQECFRTQKTSSYPAKVSFINPRFLSNNDTIPKTAIRIASGSQCVVKGMQIPSSAWNCPGGIGLHISGFEMHDISDNLVYCEQPLRISQNLANPNIGLDSSVFNRNLWCVVGSAENANHTTREAILIDSDVILTRMTMTDTVAIRGTYGFHYDGIVATNCSNIRFDGFAREQPSLQGDDLHSIYFAAESLCYGFRADNLSLGGGDDATLLTGTNGVFVGGIFGGAVDTAFYEGGLDALTVKGCRDFRWRGYWAQTGASLLLIGCSLTEGDYTRSGSYTFPISGRADIAVDSLNLGPGSYPPRVDEYDSRKVVWAGTIATGAKQTIPIEQFTGVVPVGTRKVGILTVAASNNTSGVEEGGIFISRVSSCKAIASTSSCTVGSVVSNLCILTATVVQAAPYPVGTVNVVQIENKLPFGGTVDCVVTLAYST